MNGLKSDLVAESLSASPKPSCATDSNRLVGLPPRLSEPALLEHASISSEHPGDINTHTKSMSAEASSLGGSNDVSPEIFENSILDMNAAKCSPDGIVSISSTSGLTPTLADLTGAMSPHAMSASVTNERSVSPQPSSSHSQALASVAASTLSSPTQVRDVQQKVDGAGVADPAVVTVEKPIPNVEDQSSVAAIAARKSDNLGTNSFVTPTKTSRSYSESGGSIVTRISPTSSTEKSISPTSGGIPRTNRPRSPQEVIIPPHLLRVTGSNASASSLFQHCAIPLLETNEDGSRHLSAAAAELMRAVQGPLCIVSVVGPPGSGKSRLANKLIGRLKGQSKGLGFPERSYSVSPSALGATKHEHEESLGTLGLWLWAWPWSGRLADGRPCSVLILDSEGLDVRAADCAADILPFCLAYTLSSRILYCRGEGTDGEVCLQDLGLATLLARGGPFGTAEMQLSTPSLLMSSKAAATELPIAGSTHPSSQHWLKVLGISSGGGKQDSLSRKLCSISLASAFYSMLPVPVSDILYAPRSRAPSAALDTSPSTASSAKDASSKFAFSESEVTDSRNVSSPEGDTILKEKSVDEATSELDQLHHLIMHNLEVKCLHNAPLLEFSGSEIVLLAGGYLEALNAKKAAEVSSTENVSGEACAGDLRGSGSYWDPLTKHMCQLANAAAVEEYVRLLGPLAVYLSEDGAGVGADDLKGALRPCSEDLILAAHHEAFSGAMDVFDRMSLGRYRDEMRSNTASEISVLSKLLIDGNQKSSLSECEALLEGLYTGTVVPMGHFHGMSPLSDGGADYDEDSYRNNWRQLYENYVASARGPSVYFALSTFLKAHLLCSSIDASSHSRCSEISASASRLRKQLHGSRANPASRNAVLALASDTQDVSSVRLDSQQEVPAKKDISIMASSDDTLRDKVRVLEQMNIRLQQQVVDLNRNAAKNKLGLKGALLACAGDDAIESWLFGDAASGKKKKVFKCTGRPDDNGEQATASVPAPTEWSE